MLTHPVLLPTTLTPPRYNSREHPVPFHKAQDLGKLPKKLAAEPAPDLEEAYDVSGWRPDVANINPNFGTRTMMTFRTMTMKIKRRNRWTSLPLINLSRPGNLRLLQRRRQPLKSQQKQNPRQAPVRRRGRPLYILA